jgi:Ca2+-binding RTX toxin-like protein
MQDAYNGSAIAKNMFDYWVTPPPKGAGKQIKIKFKKGKYNAATDGTGLLQIDPDYINNASYIGLNGTAIKDTPATALIHELGHALRFYQDNWTAYAGNGGDYKGDNVKFVNDIYKDLGLPQQLSYTAYDNTGTIIKSNYQYTNGKPIKAAVALETKLIPKTTWNSTSLGISDDLLIGGSSANTLQSGAGDDFLFGGRGNDKLWGGEGTDTAVYYGFKSEYDIRPNPNKDGSWLIGHVRGSKESGTDILRNIELAQFDDPKKPGEKEIFKLEKGGLAFQKDVSFVFDTTGSMGLTIGAVKAQASALIETLFSGDNDARIGIVGFKDTTNGEPSSVILPFTDQDEFADRKSAALAAINSITVGGGGDLPETDFDGLRLALNGSMGDWRSSAGTRQIVLFTDAPVKDGALAAEVTALAQNIGATIGSSSALAFAGGSVDTFNLSFNSGSSSVAGRDTEGSDIDPSLVTPTDEPIAPDPTSTPVQIFTIFTGPAGTDTAALSDIANANGGEFLTSANNDDLVKKLFEIFTPPNQIDGTSKSDRLVGTDGKDLISGLAGNDKIDGGAGNDTIYGGDGNDDIFGGVGNDTLYGDAGNDEIDGGVGNDTIYGGDGNDKISGGDGDDIIYGGDGNDKISGGAGRDSFAYINPNEGADKIDDFVASEDRFKISRAGFGGAAVFGSDSLVGSTLDLSRFTLGSSATTASQRFLYDSKSGALFFDADGIGSIDRVKIAELDGKPALTNNSFSMF